MSGDIYDKNSYPEDIIEAPSMPYEYSGESVLRQVALGHAVNVVGCHNPKMILDLADQFLAFLKGEN